MKKTMYAIMILVCSVVLLGGCISTKGVKKTSKADLSENELYAQVPEQDRGPVDEAKANQLAAAEQLKYAEELVALQQKIDRLEQQYDEKIAAEQSKLVALKQKTSNLERQYAQN